MSFKSKTQWMCQRDELLTTNNRMNKQRKKQFNNIACLFYMERSFKIKIRYQIIICIYHHIITPTFKNNNNNDDVKNNNNKTKKYPPSYIIPVLAISSFCSSVNHLDGNDDVAGHGRLPTADGGRPVSLAITSATLHSQL